MQLLEQLGQQESLNLGADPKDNDIPGRSNPAEFATSTRTGIVRDCELTSLPINPTLPVNVRPGKRCVVIPNL